MKKRISANIILHSVGIKFTSIKTCCFRNKYKGRISYFFHLIVLSYSYLLLLWASPLWKYQISAILTMEGDRHTIRAKRRYETIRLRN